jgi:hypothetical protein
MTTHSTHGLPMPMPTDTRLDPSEDGCECGYHRAQRAYGGTPHTMKSHTAAQSTPPEISILGYGGCYHALAQRSCCA